MNNMKVIQIMPEFGLAGAETMCENLTYRLIALGVEVIVVSLYDYQSAITDRMKEKGIRVVFLSKKPGVDFSMIIKLFKLFRMEKPNVIHTHRYVMQYAIPAAIIARVKGRVHTVHNIATKENDKPARVLANIFYRFFRVIPVALSSEIQRTIIQEYHLKEKKVPIILNGVDLDKCVCKTDYAIFDKFRILHIGRFSEQKNHKCLIEAFKIFRENYCNTKLILVGEGEKRSEIEKLVKDNNIQDCVEFVGNTDNVYRYLHEADMFTLSSIYEGIPMTIIEAMGTGLPIVTTNVGGIPDMVKNEESALLTSIDSIQMANAFSRLARNQSLRSQLGRKAYDVSRKFSSEKMAIAYLEIYQWSARGVK